MKLLRDILYKVEILHIIGNTNMAISSICFNSNIATKLSLFVAIKGLNTNGHDYIDSALSAGAHVIMHEDNIKLPIEDVTYIKVSNSSKSLAILSTNFYNNPSSKLKLIGITGTNGKTSTAYYLFSLLKKLNFKVGLISTIENKINNTSYASNYTTPDCIEINKLLSMMIANDCDYCIMEVSSHGILQNRIYGLDFDMAIFTNISHDHLDYHDSFSQYLKTKKILFDQLSLSSIAIINNDDPNGPNMILDTKSRKVFYGINNNTSTYTLKILEDTIDGLNLEINNIQLWSQLVGQFNAYNLLSTYSAACEMGIDKMRILSVLSELKSVPGRFNLIVSQEGFKYIVDYAHTPDALLKVIQTILHTSQANCQLITVLGCGGNRDKSKRPIMGKIAIENSSMTILTSDNPRFENPEDIITDMHSSLSKSLKNRMKIIIDRELAIQHVVSISTSQSIILIAGKGHERFQEINGQKLPFNDIEILNKYLK
jgi:UDP-N-acetylmuramoyl-L-alanyl-D-glutamate--2,6-diaminopimelate ligase